MEKICKFLEKILILWKVILRNKLINFKSIKIAIYLQFL